MNETIYKRLTRVRSRGGFAAVRSPRNSLWLGPDHLLCVDSNGYTENYKRFYFRDIQAVIVWKTKRRMVWNWILGSLAVLCVAQFTGSLMSSNSNSTAYYIFMAVASGVLGIPLFLNNLFGATCSAQLRTAVQTEELPSLCRLPKTRKILAEIRPLIAAAQGELRPEEIAARLQENIPSSGENSAAGPVPPVLS